MQGERKASAAEEARARRFIELVRECDALSFGDFTLRSGHKNPWFLDTGRFSSGRALNALSQLYAEAVEESGIRFDMLYGPPYKGIVLAAALAGRLEGDTPFTYSRKEAKEHGEGGSLVGAPIEGLVLIVDDVLTSGGSAEAACALIEAAGATPAGLVVALDRELPGEGTRSVAEELSESGLPVVSLCGARHLVDEDGARARYEE